MTVSGTALRLKLETQALMLKHRYVAEPRHIALSAPSDGPMILEGVLISCSIDLEKTKFRPWAVPILWSDPMPPLCLKHRRDEIAGEVLALTNDRGQLLVRARVEHVLGRRMGGFSICARVGTYEVREADDPERFHSLITRADPIIEVSVTDCPADPACVVTQRYAVPAAARQYELLAAKTRVLGRMVDAMKEELRSHEHQHRR